MEKFIDNGGVGSWCCVGGGEIVNDGFRFLWGYLWCGGRVGRNIKEVIVSW